MPVHRQGGARDTGDGRLNSPSFVRNAQPIIEILRQVLGDRSGGALEIGSGVGQHICAFAAALPNLRWTPSDPDQTHRASIDAWIAHEGSAANRAIDLDAAADWAGTSDLGALQAVISLNVIHIAPWPVAKGLVTGAAKALAPSGWLFLYGPFRRGGEHTSQSNAAFDASLRAQNPEWGVRDLHAVCTLTDAAGFAPVRSFGMPSNNLILAFQRLP